MKTEFLSQMELLYVPYQNDIKECDSMYRILIVDDERIERSGIQFLLKQMMLDVEVEEAPHGLAALEILKKEKFDILLTDIKMPFMDGLGLIEAVDTLYPDIRKVIFSGHSEFDYALKAMKFNVKDYILKPVEPTEFEKVIKKLITELQEYKFRMEQNEKSLGYLKEHFLYDLVNGKSVEEVEKEALSFFDLKEFNPYNRMILVEFNRDFFGEDGTDFEKRYAEKTDISIQFLNLSPSQTLLFLKDDVADIKEFGESICRFVKDNYNELCYVAISDEFHGLDRFAAAYESVEVLMEGKFYQPVSKVFLNEEAKEEGLIVQISDDTLLKRMKQDIHMKDISSLREHFDRLCDKYKHKTDFSQVYIKFIFSNLLKDFYSNIPGLDEGALNKEIDTLYRSTDLSSVMKIMNLNMNRLEQAFSKNPQMLHREIESVKTYIYENYDKELSVDILASHVNLVPSYLSHIFKKETGQNISKFIKAYRMENAKDMLENTHMKIVDISNKSGYPNVSYFCRSFREYFGISPQKYRGQGETNEEVEPTN